MTSENASHTDALSRAKVCISS